MFAIQSESVKASGTEELAVLRRESPARKLNATWIYVEEQCSDLLCRLRNYMHWVYSALWRRAQKGDATYVTSQPITPFPASRFGLPRHIFLCRFSLDFTDNSSIPQCVLSKGTTIPQPHVVLLTSPHWLTLWKFLRINLDVSKICFTGSIFCTGCKRKLCFSSLYWKGTRLAWSACL